MENELHRGRVFAQKVYIHACVPTPQNGKSAHTIKKTLETSVAF